ncbi:alpha/beta hydrolase [Myxococcota bacterium]|nr:alpha/beta hydrolase [Myxococcota bacterium]
MKTRSQRFTTSNLDGVRLHALRHGDPECQRKLILLHGGGANAHWWDHLAPLLTQGFEVIALDFRGHGDSDAPREVEVGAFHRDLEALLAWLGAPMAVLLGHSLGARIALDHAGEHGRSEAVIAIDPARGGQRQTSRKMRLALATRRTYATREEAVERFSFLPPSPDADPSLTRHVAQHSVRQENDGRWSFKFDARWFSVPSREPIPLERVMCPALILRGKDSPLLTREGALAMTGKLPRAQLVEIPDSGHNLHIEAPDRVVSAIREFLADSI